MERYLIDNFLKNITPLSYSGQLSFEVSLICKVSLMKLFILFESTKSSDIKLSQYLKLDSSSEKNQIMIHHIKNNLQILIKRQRKLI